MKKAISLLILCTLLFLTFPVFAQNDTNLASIDGGIGITLHIESLTYQDTAGRLVPSNDVYLVMLMTIENTDDDRHCVFARDIRLHYDGEEYAPERALMAAVQRELDTRRDYAGPVGGHCVDDGQSAASFVAFDVPADMDSFVITYMDQPQTFDNLQPVDSTPVPETGAGDTEADTAALTDGIALLAGGREVLSVLVADGRAKGGERAAIISYMAHETTDAAIIEEMLDILRAAAATIRADELDLDAISLLVAQPPDTVIGVMVVQVDDLLAYHRGDITEREFLQRLEFTAL